MGAFVAGSAAGLLLTVTNFTWQNVLVLVLYGFFAVFQKVVSPKRVKPWGVVYDAVSYQPIGLAQVSIYDADSHRLLKARLSDYDGRFSFLPTTPIGNYIIRVVKDGYNFPGSNVNAGPYKDNYYGDNLRIKKDQVINKNIPIDPLA